MKTESEIEQVILSGLSVSDNDGVWVAVNEALDYERKQIFKDVVEPDRTNESRHFNAGRAAALEDFKDFLQKKWEQAHSDRVK
jgi:hypothetical protein